MHKLIITLMATALSGCATPTMNVRLNYPIASSHERALTVSDARQDKNIYMLAMSYTKSQVFMFSLVPPAETVLYEFISETFSSNTETSPQQEINISMERIDLKNKVGYLQADDLYCEIESRITNNAGNIDKVVKTFSRNNTSKSPAVNKAAKVILQQCIEDHAKELAAKINVL